MHKTNLKWCSALRSEILHQYLQGKLERSGCAAGNCRLDSSACACCAMQFCQHMPAALATPGLLTVKHTAQCNLNMTCSCASSCGDGHGLQSAPYSSRCVAGNHTAVTAVSTRPSKASTYQPGLVTQRHTHASGHQEGQATACRSNVQVTCRIGFKRAQHSIQLQEHVRSLTGRPARHSANGNRTPSITHASHKISLPGSDRQWDAT